MHIELQLDFTLLASYDKTVLQYLHCVLRILASQSLEIGCEELIFLWLILYCGLNHQNLTTHS